MLRFLRPRANTFQWGIVCLGFAVFVVTAWRFGAPLYWPLVGTAVILWVALAAIARRLGPASDASYYEPGLLTFVCTIPVVTAFVMLPAGSGVDVLVTIPCALALWIGQAVWALLRYPAPQAPWAAERGTWPRNVLRGLAWGAAAAFIYSIIALLLFALGEARGEAPPADYPSLPALVASYTAGFLAAGLLVGLLRPLARFPLGAMLLGALGALCVYGAVGIPVLGFPLRPLHFFVGLAAALFIGPAFGLGFRNDAS
ncbi:MAG TPA: hypothetical protein VFU02_22965 [Polyangiaceae bacterium]|nr:hypothetical protein [Polyangiaceae bacterium]HEU6449863.1 hypothetical protein [Gemmatimonadaceae bacterium]